MNLHIKNMVCNRCKMVVKAELEKLGLNPVSVELGEVYLAEEITEQQKKDIANQLKPFGFELLEDRKKQISEQVKTIMINLIHYASEPLKINLSAHLTALMHMDYANLSAIFSEIENQTIEKYFIGQKIEKVKELITYKQLTLSEIALLLNYSSVAHLSAQFKKVTGLTTSQYKNDAERKTLDEI